MTEARQITEAAGDVVTPAQLERLCNRYYWCAPFCEGKRVAEIACGTGQGLSYLSQHARAVVGGDLAAENLAVAHDTYRTRIPLVQLDGQALPFGNATFDVLIMLETIYFLPHPERFVAEARRVLRPGGYLLLAAINKDFPEYNAHHRAYRHHFGAPELHRLTVEQGFNAHCYGTYPSDSAGREGLLRPIKRLATRLRLIPQAKGAKELLKRVFYGPLPRIPAVITDATAPRRQPIPIPSDQPDRRHLALLCAAHLPSH